ARTLGNELLGTAVRRICVSSAPSGEGSSPGWDGLVDELLTSTPEDEVLLTATGRFVPRLSPLEPTRRAPAGPYAAAIESVGMHYRLSWRPVPMPVPGPGEIVVSLSAAGLNYRDVLMATGVVPFSGDGLGLEYAGTVVATGPGVGLRIGDRVAGVGASTL